MHIPRPDATELAALATELGLTDAAERPADYLPLIDAVLHAYDAVAALPADPPDRDPVPFHRPTADEDPANAWTVRATVPGAANGPLAGRTVAVKDSIDVAGLPTGNGARLLDGYVPAHDATVVARVLAAGATVVGKTNCEYLCLSGASHTSDFGPTHNPHRHGHTAGGSSSGNAVALVTGQADLAIGGDQAGSIRVPAAYSGLVGLKPTHGLVPYTGIGPLEPVLDHTGPMTTTVADAALLLDVLAGDDGHDTRHHGAARPGYAAALDGDLTGLRVGLLREGFDAARPDVAATVRAAAGTLRERGAEVSEVSVALHAAALAIFTPLILQGTRDTVLHGQGFGSGRADRYPVAMMEHLHERRDRNHELPPNVVLTALAGELATRGIGKIGYARAVNAARRLRADYDDALAGVDVLLMPTTPTTAPPLPAADADLATYCGMSSDMFANTAAFNATGHPALSVPCGRIDGLPVGMMLVGGRDADATVLRAGHAYEVGQAG